MRTVLAAAVVLMMQLHQAAGLNILANDSREKWVYLGIFLTFLGGSLFLCFLFKCWRCCRCRSRVNDQTPIFPDSARQWCPDVYTSPLVAQELFELQVSQSIPVKHRNWPPHRVLIRRTLREEMEREARAREEAEWRRRHPGQTRRDPYEELQEYEDVRRAAIASGTV